MPEKSAVAERYRPARLTKMPRNRADKKDLDVRIGSANLPVSQPLTLSQNPLRSWSGRKKRMTIPHCTPLRSVNLVVASDASCRCAPVKRSALPATSQRIIGFSGQPYSNAVAEMRLKK
jgi:hypothetical protein